MCAVSSHCPVSFFFSATLHLLLTTLVFSANHSGQESVDQCSCFPTGALVKQPFFEVIRASFYSDLSGSFGILVTALVSSTKLSDVESGEYEIGDLWLVYRPGICPGHSSLSR